MARFTSNHILATLSLASLFTILVYFILDFKLSENWSLLSSSKNELVRMEIQIPFWEKELYFQAHNFPISKKRKYGNFLAIGISTVFRKENYLQKTLTSLTEGSTEEERQDVVIIIYLADKNPQNKEKQRKIIASLFSTHLISGFLQVIDSTPKIYPPMDFASYKRTFNDSTKRVLWRAKQVIDFAFLFAYSQSLTQFYLNLEDDVIASPGYLTAIRDFIGFHQQQNWIAMEFTQFYGIGLLFRSEELKNLVKLFLIFFEDIPVDGIMREFISMRVPDKETGVLKRNPSLFQHIGRSSSLPNKTQLLEDTSFGIPPRQFPDHRNPQADIKTSMKTHNGFFPLLSYRTAPGYFWGELTQDLINGQDTFDIIFSKPLTLNRIVVISGLPDGIGVIKNGSIQVSNKLLHSKRYGDPLEIICENYFEVERISNGKADLEKIGGIMTSVSCLRIVVTKSESENESVIIREIQVF